MSLKEQLREICTLLNGRSNPAIRQVLNVKIDQLAAGLQADKVIIDDNSVCALSNDGRVLAWASFVFITGK